MVLYENTKAGLLNDIFEEYTSDGGRLPDLPRSISQRSDAVAQISVDGDQFPD